MVKILSRFIVYLVVSLFWLNLARGSYAYFEDNFLGTSVDAEVWSSFNNAGNISVNEGKLTLLRSPGASTSFPYLFTKDNIFPQSGSFSVRIKYQYLSTGSFGDGITISSDAAPLNGVDPDSNLNSFMSFMIWQDTPNGLSFGKILCDLDGNNCNTRTFIRSFTHVPDLNPHEIRIDFTDEGQYLFFFDNSAAPEFTSGINQPRPTKIWLGNSLVTNSSDLWSSFEVDYIHVLPITNETYPVIVVPGFGASWDVGALLAGTPGNNWQIPSFIKNYDGILQSFRNAGLVDNESLFIFPYDWRKPLTSLADDLNSFINSKNLTGKVNLVGHSMGGLVTRAYGQKYGVTKVDKILTVGSPHLGVVDMYGLWEGAKTWDDIWWEKVLLETATEVNRLPNESKVGALRRISPSVIDLFPTFPFLKLNGDLIGIDTMTQKNSYLKILNQDVSVLENKLTPFWSDDIGSTRKDINVVVRSADDVLQNMWEDGRPVGDNPFGATSGDGSVTKESAVGPFSEGGKLTGWHADLLSSKSNAGKILQKLNLDPSLAVSSATDNRKTAFVAVLRSPGILEVCDVQLVKCNDQLGLYFPESKLFILPGYNDEELVVKVKESGFGAYKLHLGNIDESPDWTVENGNLQNTGQVDFYGVKSDGENVSVILDNTSPEVTITTPLATTYQSANLPSPAYSVVDNWDINPNIAVSGWSNEEGEHTLTVMATDDAGNVETRSVTYWVDNTSPVVNITSPLATTYQSSSLPGLTYTVQDNQDTNPTIATSGWSNTEGQHTIVVTATDKAGNVGTASISYTIANTKTLSNKDQCKNNLWLSFGLFKNQGACVSFVEKNNKAFKGLLLSLR